LLSLTLLALTRLALTLSLVLTIVAAVTTIASIVTAVVASVVATVIASIVSTVVASAISNLETDAIVLGSTLGNRHKHRLVVARRSHGADAIKAYGEATGKISTQQSVSIASVVDSLEEGKFFGIEGLGWVGIATQVLNCDVRVADNLTSLEALRGRIVRVIRVGELSSRQIGNLDRESHLGVWSHNVTVLRARKHCRNHTVCGRYLAHRDTVARSLADLESISKRFASTEVDEIGVVSRRSSLTLLGFLLETGRRAVLLNIGRVQGEVAAATTIVVLSVVLTVVLTIVLAVVLAIVLAVVLAVVLAIVLAIVLTLSTSTELSIGDTCHKQDREQC